MANNNNNISEISEINLASERNINDEQNAPNPDSNINEYFQEKFGDEPEKDEQTKNLDNQLIMMFEYIYNRKKDYTYRTYRRHDNSDFEGSESDPNILKELAVVSHKNLIDLLKETKGVIAGGSVLNMVNHIPGNLYFFQDYWVSDIDIFIPVKHIVHAIRLISSIFKPQKAIVFESGFYCTNFMKRNGIQRIYRFSYEVPYLYNFNIDLVAVRNKTDILDVVKNFDFTFCQIWYDGRKISATHPEHVKNKSGYLKGPYVKEALQNNKHTLDRIRKYKNKEYTIEFDPEELQKLIPVRNVKPQFTANCRYEDRTEEWYETWYKKMLKELISGWTGKAYPFWEQYFFERKSDALRGAMTYRKFKMPKTVIIKDDIPNLLIRSDDGYDTDDMETDNDYLKLFNSLYSPRKFTIFNIDAAKADLPLNFAQRIKFHNLFPFIYSDNSKKKIPKDASYQPFIHPVYKCWRFAVEKAKQQGECFITKKNPTDVYMFHVEYHKKNEVISGEGLEQHMEAHKDEFIKPDGRPVRSKMLDSVKCYVPGCTQRIYPEDLLFKVRDDWFLNYYRQLYFDDIVYPNIYNNKFILLDEESDDESSVNEYNENNEEGKEDAEENAEGSNND